jgi:hypothetical protein
MTHPLDGCWAKIERAKEHRRGLEAYLRETFSVDENRVGVGIRFDSDVGEHILYISRVPDLSSCFINIALLAGDALQNLRSSLDHLTWQLALLHTDGQIRFPKRVQFPIVDNPDDWAEVIGKRAAIAEIAAGHRAIIERFQPYHRETVDGPLMGVLRDFSNTDKHQLLVPVMILPVDIDTQIGVAQDLITAGIFPRTSRVILMPYGIELGAPFMALGVPQRVIATDVRMYRDFRPTMAFSEGRPVLDTLDFISETVIRVIREFEPVF